MPNACKGGKMNEFIIETDDLDPPEKIEVDCPTCRGAGGPCHNCGGRGYFIEIEGRRVYEY